MSCDNLKRKLTTANIPQIALHNEIPKEFEYELSLYKFRKYVTDKSFLYKTVGSKKWYRICPTTAFSFLEEHFLNDFEEDVDYMFAKDGSMIVSDKSLEKHFKKKAVKFLNWLSSEDALHLANRLALREDWNKYVKSSSIERWEMETVSYYNDKHELEDVDEDSYGIVNYFELPEIPIVVEEGLTKKGRPFKKFKIDTLIGTVIDKDANKHFISLLTKYGVVSVKFSKGAFSFYNKQLSEVDVNTGKKTVLEKSWFSRGSMLLVRGFRDGDLFRARSHGDMHSLNKIEGVQPNKLMYLTLERSM